MTNIGLEVIITLIIAIIGVIVSIYSVWNARQQNKREVKVSLRYGALLLARPLPRVILSAKNTGNKTVTLSSMGLILPRKENNYFIPHHPDTMGLVTFPHDLKDGKNCDVYLEPKNLAEELRLEGFSGKIKVKGFYRDAIGRKYKSKSFTFNIDNQ